MTKSKKSVLSKAKQGSDDESKVAFEAMRAELMALRPEELYSVNVDIPRAASIALGAETFIRAYAEEIEELLPQHDMSGLEKLRSYALGAVYAHLQSQPVSKNGDVVTLFEEASQLRAELLVAADALAYAGLVDADRVAQIRSGQGQLDTAADLLGLGTLFAASWDVLASKTAVERAKVDRASKLGVDLLAALGEKGHSGSQGTPESIDLRNRAFTLLVNAYDSCKRALTYVRWYEGDADTIAPTLYQRSRKRPAAPVVVPEPTPAAPPGAPPSTASPTAPAAPTGPDAKLPAVTA